MMKHNNIRLLLVDDHFIVGIVRTFEILILGLPFTTPISLAPSMFVTSLQNWLKTNPEHSCCWKLLQQTELCYNFCKHCHWANASWAKAQSMFQFSTALLTYCLYFSEKSRCNCVCWWPGVQSDKTKANSRIWPQYKLYQLQFIMTLLWHPQPVNITTWLSLNQLISLNFQPSLSSESH